MAWGDPGVSKLLKISNGAIAWGTAALPLNVPIQQTGILERLRMYTAGTPTFTAGTGTIAADAQGPYNVYSLHSLSPNQQAPIVLVSGYGLYLINLMLEQERKGFSPDTNAVTVANGAATADIFTGRVTSGSDWYWWLDLPITQHIRSLGGRIGYWPLQNPAMQLSYQFTVNASGTYNIYSTTALASPYLTTGVGTVTLASPTNELMRYMYQVPEREQDFPPFNLVSTWIEEAPQGASVLSATQVQWQATPLSGLLARLIVYVQDGTDGVAYTKLTAANALNLTYDANTTKFALTGRQAEAEWQGRNGFQAPPGSFFFDLLGADLTLADVLNTNTVGNIKMFLNFSSALSGSAAAVKIIRQMISPLEVK